MHIALHIGANCTDGDMLVRSLTKNARTFAPMGTAIPGLAKYRKLLRETIQNLQGSTPLPETRDRLVSQITDLPTPQRLVMSNSAFICLPARIYEAGEFYGLTNMKMRAIDQLFPNDEISLYLALRNPATFIPEAFGMIRNRSFAGFMNGVDPRVPQWSELVTRIRGALPRAHLTVWCNEDTPLIWGEILRRMTGAPDGTAMGGEYDVLSTIMTEEGMKRFHAYLGTHPPKGEAQLRRVIAAFLDKYAIPEAIEDEINLPDWDEAMVEQLTVLYEADVDRISDMDGVTFITP